MKAGSELSYRDSLFLVDTLMPGVRGRERTAAQVRSDEQIISAMLDDEQLFARLMADDAILVSVSPHLFFRVLLRRARRDMERETFSIERRSLQKVVIFDNDKVVELLGQEGILEYLAGLLASFTRVESTTIPVRVRKGVWHRYRVSDVDVDSLIRFSHVLDESSRFEWFQRIGDTCLFLAGLFPEYIEAQHRYPFSRQRRPRTRGSICGSLEDYEAHGRAFYKLAGEHAKAGAQGLESLLETMSESFILAEKPLAFLADRYLQLKKRQLFDL